jgi:SAM-dependent methyltransferase
MPADFDALLAEALAAPTDGWDLGRFGGRLHATHPGWSYWDMVGSLASGSASLLDLGTGGGERLADFADRCPNRPPLTVATESWAPNVPVAARRLRPLRIPVVHAEGAPDNDGQAAGEPLGRLPFRDGAFALVIDRHEAFNAREVARVLAAGGTFLTQQVGSDYRDLHELLGFPWRRPAPVTHELFARQVEAAGLELEDGVEAEVVQTFADAGVLGWYLRQVPWAVPDFDVRRDASRLRAVHERIVATGPVRVRQRQLWLRAVKRRGV